MSRRLPQVSDTGRFPAQTFTRPARGVKHGPFPDTNVETATATIVGLCGAATVVLTSDALDSPGCR